MKIFLLLALCFTLHAADLLGSDAPGKLPSAAQALVEKTDADVAKLHAALAEKLAKLQDAATKKGDLAGALAIKAKIEELAKAMPAAEKVEKPLAGVYDYDFKTGHQGRLEINKNVAVADGIQGVLVRDGDAATITWANKSQWTITAENGAWWVQANDGRSELKGGKH